MVSDHRTRAAGEETLVASWAALAALSPGAHLVHTQRALAAVFPQWEPLNNAILFGDPSVASASAAAAELAGVFACSRVASWALWVPNHRLDLAGPDVVAHIDGMRRDVSTLAMACHLREGLPADHRARRTTVELAALAGDRPLPAATLAAPDSPTDLEAWVLVDAGFAVAGAWTYRNGTDVGLYAIGTAPEHRRRGLARALVLHVLGDAYARGARTASLQSTPMGEPLYAGLGFVPVGRYDEFVPTSPLSADALGAEQPKEETCMSC
jgi:GNAT superfamily N-acetyltransferase